MNTYNIVVEIKCPKCGEIKHRIEKEFDNEREARKFGGDWDCKNILVKCKGCNCYLLVGTSNHRKPWNTKESYQIAKFAANMKARKEKREKTAKIPALKF